MKKNKPLQHLKELCYFLFKVKIYKYQLEILEAIFKKKKKKITIRSPTRAGKSFVIAMAAILYAVFNDNVRVGIIAPDYEKTKAIMDYIAIFLAENEIFKDIVMVETKELTRLERLKRELSKKRITFKNNSLIEIRSIVLQKKGMGVMGFGYDFSICIPSNSLITTNKGFLKIEDIVNKKISCKVLSYNHSLKKLEYKSIKKYYKNGLKNILRIHYNGGYVECTENHPVYVIGKGYIPASKITIGDKLVGCGYDLNSFSYKLIYAFNKLRDMWKTVLQKTFTYTKNINSHLFSKMQRNAIFKKLFNKEENSLSYLWKNKIINSLSISKKQITFLFKTLQRKILFWEKPSTLDQKISNKMFNMQKRKNSNIFSQKSEVLFNKMSKQSTCKKHGKQRQSYVERRNSKPSLFAQIYKEIKRIYKKTIRLQMCKLFNKWNFSSPSYRLQQTKHKNKKSDSFMFSMSWKDKHKKKLLEEKVVKNIEKRKKTEVYNLEIKDNNNYFVNGILTHNCDEVSLIDRESYSKIYRMLVENPNALMLEIGNPWFLNQFYDHHNSKDWYKIHINWKDCVKEERMTKKAVIDQKNNMSALSFQVLFEAEFPLEVDWAVFKEKAIENCIKEKKFKSFDKYLIGVDVARGGTDLSVITVMGKYKDEFSYITHRSSNTNDTMKLTGLIRNVADKYKNKQINIDIIGVGAGVYDRLKELKYPVKPFQAGLRAIQKNKYYNQKTEIAFTLARKMEEGKFYNLPKNSQLLLELRSWIYEIRSDKTTKIIDPDKSPDCFIAGTKILTNKGYKPIENIKKGEYVITPFGTRIVTNTIEKTTDNLIILKTKNNKEIICTPNHKIFSNNKFIKSDRLIIRDKLEQENLWSLIKWRLKNLLSIKKRNIGFQKQINDITIPTYITELEKKEERKKLYTIKYGKTLINKEFQKDTVFIILMEIVSIIILKISNFLKEENIKGNICLKNLKIKNIEKKIINYLNKSEVKHQNGIDPKKEKNGIKNIIMNHLQKLKNIPIFVKNVITNLKVCISILLNGAQKNAELKEIIKINVKNVKVYNLTVEKDNCYYANGILVSNCADSLLIAISKDIRNTKSRVITDDRSVLL